MAKTAVDPAFLKLVPKGSTCFLIWRIEDFSPQPLPRDQYGTFYDGDCYIVLAALEKGSAPGPGMKAIVQGDHAGPKMKVKEVRTGKLDIRIHFWLGKDSSQDEQGTAAIKTVELDDYLGGSPMQYREVQGTESKIFLKYFKDGLKVLKGGVKSGFNHVDMTHKNRLYSVKGKGTPRVTEIDISWSNMNEGDVYILDLGEVIFIWNGQSASRTEKMKAAQYAQRLRSDRGQVTISILEQGEEDDLQAEERELFEEHLPLSGRGSVKSAEQGGSDDAYERQAAKDLKLWKVAEEGKALKVTEVAQGPLKRDMLDTNDCFIVDNGPAGLFVWIGRKATKAEKDESMNNAAAFVKQRNLANARIVRVVEEGEPPEFKTLFKVWEKPLLPGQMRAQNTNKIARTVQTKFDASTLHDNPQLARETGMVDDGSGEKKVYRVIRMSNEQYDKEEVKKPDSLFGGDCYIIHYTYTVNGRQRDLLYFWLGRHSTQDERGVAALLTVRVDDELGGLAEQIRVVHGKEPPHFLAMFQGRLVIYDGGRVGQAAEETPEDTHLIQVRGTSQLNCKAEQVPMTSESLNSNDCFVLFVKGGTPYIWAGKGSTGDEREMAKSIAKRSPKSFTLVCEGQEKDDFWQLLGGKKEYSTSPRLSTADESAHHPARLFQGSNASGTFKVDEIVDFVQEDLVPEDVFILDAYHTIFVWIGDEANEAEKTHVFDAALEYLATDPSGRDEDIPIKKVKQGRENTEFVGYFGIWDWERWSGFKSYEQMKQELGADNLSMDQVKKKSSSGGEQSFSDIIKYPYEDLIKRDNLPEGIDTLHKEKHLTNEDFERVFNMSYSDFVKMMAWKQKQLKEKAQLF